MSDKLVKASAEVAPASSFALAVKVAVDGAAAVEVAVERHAVGPHTACSRCRHVREDHFMVRDASHCLMPDCGCKLFASAALARSALERCPACGSASMRDAQAQFVGACSPTCAKALGISDEVLRASARVPPAQLDRAFDALILTQCKKCWGVGSVSVPGELVDAVCNACGGTGNEERIGPDGRRT